MKILFAGSYNSGETLSGPEKVARRIFNCFSKDSDKFTTAFITYFFDGREYGLFKKLFGYEHLEGNGGNKVYRLGLLRILLIAFKFRPDIIHIITFERFAVLLFFYKLFSKVKIIYNVHGIAVYENSLNQNASGKLIFRDAFCEKIFFKYSDTLIFLSELSVQTAKKFYNFDDIKSVIIPNGIDKEFHETGINRKPVSNDTLKIVFIGEVSKKEKGFSELITTFNKISYPIKLFVVSNSQPDVKTREAINENNDLEFHLIDKMDTEKYSKFLSDKDIYISASSYEQFSISAVESMAAGLIPVVSAATGMSSFIENGINGFVYLNGNQLINILNELNSNRESITVISGKAKLIYDELNTAKVIQKYKDIYK